ncbi:hypothetical protein [Rhizosaccharibacter radicis]|uniref:Uncharacterized protein n=1 Tax=Rhizosaccharibacter radicis TaxID=2782605 RepID=A0ABT1W2H4_9PROT|nr:hypothetical protein [Acetobacteraceae bacterium KSS12]
MSVLSGAAEATREIPDAHPAELGVPQREIDSFRTRAAATVPRAEGDAAVPAAGTAAPEAASAEAVPAGTAPALTAPPVLPRAAGGLRAHVSQTTTSLTPFFDNAGTGRTNPARPWETSQANLFLQSNDMRQGSRVPHEPAVADATVPAAARGAWNDAARLSAKQILLSGPDGAALSPQWSKASDLASGLASSASGKLDTLRGTVVSGAAEPAIRDVATSDAAFHRELSGLFEFDGAEIATHPLTRTLNRLAPSGSLPNADKLVAARSAAALFGPDPMRSQRAMSAIQGGAITLGSGPRGTASSWDQERAWQLAGLLSTTGGGWRALGAMMPRGGAEAAGGMSGAAAELRQKSLKVVLQARHALALDRNATSISQANHARSLRGAAVNALTGLPTRAAVRTETRARADDIELHQIELPSAAPGPLPLNASFAQKVEQAARAVWRDPNAVLDPARPLTNDERLVFAWRQGFRDERSLAESIAQFETAAGHDFGSQEGGSVGQLARRMLPFGEGGTPSVFDAVAAYGAMGAHLRYVHEIQDAYDGHLLGAAQALGEHIGQIPATERPRADALDLAFHAAALNRIVATRQPAPAGEAAADAAEATSAEATDSGATDSGAMAAGATERPRLHNDALSEDERSALIRDAVGEVNAARPGLPPVTIEDAHARLATSPADLPGLVRHARDRAAALSGGAAASLPGAVDEHLGRMGAIERGDPLLPASGSLRDLRAFHLKLVDDLPMGDRVRWLRGQTGGITNSRIGLSRPTTEFSPSHGDHQPDARGAGVSLGGGPDIRGQVTTSSTSFVNSGGYGIDWSMGRQLDLSGSAGAAFSASFLAAARKLGLPVSVGGRLTSTEQMPTGYTLRVRRELDEENGTRKVYADGPRRGEPVSSGETTDAAGTPAKTEDQYRFEMKRLMNAFFDHAESKAAGTAAPESTFFDQVAKLGMGSDLITVARQDHRFSTVSAEINAGVGVQGRWTAAHPGSVSANLSASRQVDLLDGLNRADGSGLDRRLIVQSGHSAREPVGANLAAGLPSIPVSSRPDAAVSSVSLPAVRIAGTQNNMLERGVLASFRTLKRDGAFDQQQTYRDVEFRTLSALEAAIDAEPGPVHAMIGRENLQQALTEMRREDDLNKRYTLRSHATPEVTDYMDTFEALSAAAHAGASSPEKAAAARQLDEKLADELTSLIADDRHYGVQGIYAVESVSNRTRVGMNMIAELDRYASAAGDHETMWIGAGNAAWNQALAARRDAGAAPPAAAVPVSRPVAEADRAAQGTEADI